MNAAEENWNLLVSLFPVGWQEQAVLQGAVERLRGFASTENLLRVLLMHVAQGYSLRETAVHAKQAGLGDVSDVALLKRLRQAESWWREICVGLLRDSGWHMGCDSRGWTVRAVDGTLIKEPGPSGSLWRIHYSLRLPELVCDRFALTAVKGKGTGETLQRFEAAPGDLVLADRGFCKPPGIVRLSEQDAAVVVRWNTRMPLWTRSGKEFAIHRYVQQLREPGMSGEWKVWVRSRDQSVAGRLCVIRKSHSQAERDRRKILRKAQQGGPTPKQQTLDYADFVMVFTTLPAAQFSLAEVLNWYRLRWQVELVFKRMKTLTHLGHLPKHDERSSRAWLYGKLMIALLGQKLMRLGRDISPWGYETAELGAQ